MTKKYFQKPYLKLCELKPEKKYPSNVTSQRLGIIYTIYSDKYNLLEINYLENEKILDNKILINNFTLLGKRRGDKRELLLLKETLQSLGLKMIDDNYFQFSNSLIRHLSTLGWPVGRSLYKQRKIKKELSFA